MARRPWRLRLAVASVTLGVLAMVAAAQPLGPRLAPPVPAPGGVLRWAAAAESVPADLAPWRQALEGPQSSDSSRLVAWRALARLPRWRLFALRRVATLELAAGDSAAADTALAVLAEHRSIWQWPALDDHVALALARGDSAAALHRLEDAGRAEWPDEDRAQWLSLDATLRAAHGDSATAIDLGRQAIRRYPALPSTAKLLPRWEAWLKLRGERPSADDQRAAAEVEFFKPDRAAAARRLGEVVKTLQGPERAAVGLRLGEMLRLARRYGEADAALAHAEHDADRAQRARIELERARVARDAGRLGRAASGFGKAADLALDPVVRELAYWERARGLEPRGEWKRAREDYARVAGLGLARASDAALRAGLLWYVEGRPDSARALWARSGSEGAGFWSAISRRRSDRAAADSALAVLARIPGYTFYRAAARDTLGLAGRPPGIAPAPSVGTGDPTLALARDLIAVGEHPEAAAIIQRWYAGDGRLGSSSRSLPRRPGSILEASRLAYAAGRPSLGIQIARRAVDSVPESSTVERWSMVPWAYPPAYDSLVSACADTGARAVLDRHLLFALIWQESKFDAAARSRSNAIGLMQLKPGVARALALMRRDGHAPGETGLMDPATNVRFGRQLLDDLAKTFAGQVTLILAAYNAGPTSAARWRRPETVGGEALEAELFEYAETQDYVKSILAARQAYRELSPRAAGGLVPRPPSR
jgi:hypothetical protein